MAVKFCIVLVSLLAAVSARRAPNSDRAGSLLKTNSDRYSHDVAEDSNLDVPSLITKYGYPQETHQVVTSDGYILEMHRIPNGKENNTPGPKPVVFVMHGLLSSSADFIVLGPGSALAYLLAEAGYDVWLGNARGNFYSRNHLTIDPDARNQNFWRFSWDDIGNHDLPAFIDYILETTGQSKLHYIGHSQGGTSFLVLNALRPEYNDKFISFQGLAPASFFINNEVDMFRSLAPMESILETAAFALGFGEIFGGPEFINWFVDNYCSGSSSSFDALCSSPMVTGESDNPYMNSTLVPLIYSHAPAGASIRQIAHYGQVIRFGTFRRYNYNIISNIANYGSTTPPTYDLSRVTAPSYLHYGLADKEVNFKDLHLLADRLPNVVGKYQIERESFNHFDFLWAIDAKDVLYNKVIKLLKEAESKL